LNYIYGSSTLLYGLRRFDMDKKIELSKDTINAINQLAAEQSISISEVIRKCVATELYLQKEIN